MSSIQGEIEDCLSTLLRKKIDVIGCGRTDKGVHASDYYLHFDTVSVDPASLRFKMNRFLPPSIAVKDIIKVHDGAHARFDAISRSYVYHVHLDKSPFRKNFSFQYAFGEKPSLEKLEKAAKILTRYEDFDTFCKAHTDVKTKKCVIKRSEWRYIESENRFEYHVTADRFLRGMVRLIVGMCINVSRDRLTLQDVIGAMENRDRLKEDYSVPAHGLFLCDIQYPYLKDGVYITQ